MTVQPRSPARFLSLHLLLVCLLQADWPQFRGPGGQGHGEASEVPLEWSESRNVTWKTAVPGLGWSSPVIGGGAVWLTTATENGRSLRAVKLDAASGEIVVDVEVIHLDSVPGLHDKNSHASATAVLEDERVYVHYGAQGTAALDLDGNVIWTNREHTYSQAHGTGGSPVLFEDLLIFNGDGTDRQFMVALDKNTGKTVWRTPRPNGRMGFSTPLLIETANGPQVVSTGGDRAVAYDPRTGREIWWITYDGFSLVPRPVFGHGLVYLTSGFHDTTLFAVRPDGRGDVTDTDHVAWTWRKSVPRTPSPLLVGNEIYIVRDNGIATCLDARTGKQVWTNRVPGGYSASPLYAAGRIYLLNESAETLVLRPGRKFELLATNVLDGRSLATPAVVGKAIYIRTANHLYRIEQP